MKKRNIILALLLTVGGLSCQAGASQPARPMLAEFNVAPGGEPILLPVTMLGKTYQFLLDTGANRTTFDTRLQSLLGTPKQTFQAEMADGKTHQMHIYYAPDAVIGPLSLKTAGAVFCVDLASLREATGLPIDGVVGNTFLRKYAVQIDFDAGKVRFFGSGPEEPAWGQALEMQLLPNGVPVVMATLGEDIENIMLVDTGFADTGVLPGKLFDLLHKIDGVPTAATKYLTETGEAVESAVGRMKEFRLEELHYRGLIFDRSDEAASLLGLRFLARHTVTFDFENDKLCLKPGKEYSQPDEIDMSGLHLLRKNGEILIHSLDDHSPAAAAGLKVDDVLLKVNGTDVVVLTLPGIRRVLCSGAGKTVEVIFRRDGKGFKTNIVLRKRI